MLVKPIVLKEKKMSKFLLNFVRTDTVSQIETLYIK